MSEVDSVIADAVEAAECWEAALAHASGPVSLVFARQNLPLVRANRWLI